jgi:hypothetical protein
LKLFGIKKIKIICYQSLRVDTIHSIVLSRSRERSLFFDAITVGKIPTASKKIINKKGGYKVVNYKVKNKKEKTAREKFIECPATVTCHP